MTKVYFRADGSAKIGLGHVIRSLALVEMLRGKFECIFIIRNPSFQLKEQILNSCSSVIELGNPKSDIKEAVKVTQIFSSQDIVVLDGYHFETSYQKEIKKSGCKLVSIDDIFSCHFLSDIVINHSPGLSFSSYSVEIYTKLMLGVEYSLIRTPFLNSGQIKRNLNGIKNVFVCFGGSDYNNITMKVLYALSKVNYNFDEIHVVLGSAYKHEAELRDKVSEFGFKLTFHNSLSAEEMVEVMSTCQLAIVPASSILYEICSVGMHVISGYFVENQINVNKGFSELGLIYSIGDFNKITNLETLISNYLEDPGKTQIDIQQRHFDGLSGKHLLKTFQELHHSMFNLRNATNDDCDLYFNWANDRSVRVNAINQGEIPYDNHCIWFESKLTSENSKLYVLTKNNEIAVGQIRFDITGEDAIISYSIDSNWRGFGLGKVLVEYGIRMLKNENILNLKNILAEVKTINIASLKVFKALKFKEVQSESKNIGLELFKLAV